MGIELTRPQPGGRALANLPDKKVGRVSESDAGNGFGNLMESLSNEDDQSDDLAARPPETGQNLLDTAMAVVDIGLAQTAPPSASSDVDTGLSAVTVDGSAMTKGATSPASAARLAVNRAKGGEAALVGAPVATALASGTNAARVALPEVAAPLQANEWLVHRNALQAHALSAAEQESKIRQGVVLATPGAVAADVAAAWVLGQGEALVRPADRFAAKSSVGGGGTSGVEGGFGGVFPGTSRTDLTYEIPASSAVVAETAVAETVSYWASHGVQTAELALDGFGDSPVEVRIVLNGDQAQVDFRTDQAGVRQMLDTATSQLKDLLLSQGLQLVGVSVGTSGKGSDRGDDRHARQNAYQAKLPQTEALGAVNTRVGNPAVGRSLDLFV